jgi:Tfp pilus assembly protein PilO
VKTRLQSLPPRALVGLAAAVVLLYGAALWFVLISPARADAAAAKEDLAAAELRLVEAQTTSRRPQSRNAPVADVLRLAKAMPGSAEQPGLVLELSRLAKRSGVTLQGIAPQDPAAAVGGPSLIPLRVTVGGSYAQITKFLRLTRGLVAVRNGKIHARGRLLSVESMSLVESVVHGFPRLDATITVNAYVYDGPIVPEEVPTPSEDEPLDGTSTAIGSTGS